MSVTIAIRPATMNDAVDVHGLLVQLGYVLEIDAVTGRLGGFLRDPARPVLLAVDIETVVGLIAVAWAPMLQADKPVGRITTLVVRDIARGTGVGRRLVDAALEIARRAGCGRLEVTTALRRVEAQAFYRAVGFTASSMRLHRDLET
jgi:GNAT superfamily N-acetyltransferase